MAPTLPCLVRSFVMLLDARCHEDPHGTTMDPVYLHVLKYKSELVFEALVRKNK